MTKSIVFYPLQSQTTTTTMNPRSKHNYEEGFQLQRDGEQNGVKRTKTSSDQYFSHSPYFEVTDEDFRLFKNEAMKKYGVNSVLSETEKQIKREKLRLLSEVRIPLNNCGSKFITIGLDPFNNFRVSVRILKLGFDEGIVFTTKTFGAFVDELYEVFINFRDGTANKINLEDYLLCCFQNKVIRLSHKNGDGFQLYLAESTLLRLQEIQQFLFAKINSLASLECHFSKFCDDIVDDVANVLGMSLNNELILTTANTQYREDLLIRELVCKFPTFVKQEISKLLD